MMGSWCTDWTRKLLREWRTIFQVLTRLGRPVDVFVTYDGKRASDIALSKYAVRHLVATEVSSACVWFFPVSGVTMVAAQIDEKLSSMRTEPVEKGKPKRSGFFNNRA